MSIKKKSTDGKSTSSLVTMFEKHVNYFWDNIKLSDDEEFKPNYSEVLSNP